MTPGPSASRWRRCLQRMLGLRLPRPGFRSHEPDPHELGRIGEQMAVRMLARDGLRIIARNRRFAGVEVDVLAESPAEDLLLVIEVKTGRGPVPPEIRVDRSRRRRLARAASSLARDRAVAIEVVSVRIVEPKPVIRRIRLDPAEIESAPLRGPRTDFSDW